MRDDDRSRIAQERLPDYLARTHLGAIDGAVEELGEVNQPVPGIQESGSEDFPLQPGQLVAEVGPSDRRILERCAALHALVHNLAGSGPPLPVDTSHDGP